MTHRLFVAIPLSIGLQEKIAAWHEPYTHWPVRFLSGKNLHLTVIPPWAEADLSAARARLRAYCGQLSAFSYSLEVVEFGPSKTQPRLIWARGPSLPQAIRLKQALAGISPEPQTLKLLPHVTLGRFKPEDFEKIPKNVLPQPIDWWEVANKVVLMESHLAPGGADYKIIEIIELV